MDAEQPTPAMEEPQLLRHAVSTTAAPSLPASFSFSNNNNNNNSNNPSLLPFVSSDFRREQNDDGRRGSFDNGCGIGGADGFGFSFGFKDMHQQQENDWDTSLESCHLLTTTSFRSTDDLACLLHREHKLLPPRHKGEIRPEEQLKPMTEKDVQNLLESEPVRRDYPFLRGLSFLVSLVTASDGDQPVLYASENFEGITLYPKSLILGRNCRFLQGKCTNRETVKRMRRAVERKESCEIEILNYRRNGVPFWNRFLILPVREETGAVTRFLGIQQDVTLLKEAGSNPVGWTPPEVGMWLDHIDLGEYSRNAVKQKVTGQELMEDSEESIINKLHIEHTSEQTLLRAALKVIRTDTANCFSFFSCADSNLSPSSSSSPLHNITDFEKLSLESLKKYYAEAVQRLRQNRDGEGEGEEEKGSKKRKNGTQQHSPPKKLQWDARTFFHSSAERITKMTVRCIWKDELRLFSVAPDASLDRLKAKVSFIFEDILNGDSDCNGGDGWDRRASPIKRFFSEDQGQEENEEANCEIEKRECRRRKAKEKGMMVTEERYGTNAANERWCRWGGLSLASCLDETEEAKEEENEEREEEEEEEHKGKGKKERKDDERRTKRRKIDFDQNASAKSELVSKGRFKQGREEQKGEAQTADYYDGKLRSPDEGGPQGTEEELQQYRTTTNEAGSSGEENARLVGKSGEAFWLVAVDFRNKVLRSQTDWEQVVSQIQLEDNCIRRKVVLRLVPALATYTTSPQPAHL